MSQVNQVGRILRQLNDEYQASTPKKLKLIDAYLFYVLLTGIVQFAYCLLVGTFPFNSFLSGFISTVGSFILAGQFPVFFLLGEKFVVHSFRFQRVYESNWTRRINRHSMFLLNAPSLISSLPMLFYIWSWSMLSVKRNAKGKQEANIDVIRSFFLGHSLFIFQLSLSLVVSLLIMFVHPLRTLGFVSMCFWSVGWRIKQKQRWFKDPHRNSVECIFI